MPRKMIKPGQVVEPHVKLPDINSHQIIADQDFLALVHSLAGLPLPGYDAAELAEFQQLQKNFATFCDNESYPVATALLDRTPSLIVDETDPRGANKYQPEMLALAQKYREAGFTGITGAKEYGGSGLPKALLGGISGPGFNTFPAQYLGEIVRQADIHLMEHAVAAASGDKKLMLENILRKIISGEYTAAMILTEPKTGANLGANMECYATLSKDSDNVVIIGEKKYITGLTKPEGTENSIGIIVSASMNEDGEVLVDKNGKTLVTVSLVPLYMLDEKGNTREPLVPNKIVTGKWIDKNTMRAQMLQQHDFTGAEGFVLGEPLKGWNMMFKVMDAARLEIAHQAVSHIYTVWQMASHYTAKRSADTTESISVAARDETELKLNRLRAFTICGASVLMKMGTHLDLVGLKDDEIPKANPPRDSIIKQQAEARDLLTVEAPMVKCYFTNQARKLMIDGVHMLGTDGLIQHQVKELEANLRPTDIYEGPNEMMAKQVVMQQFYPVKDHGAGSIHIESKMDVFVKQTRENLKEWKRLHTGVTTNSMIESVTRALNDLQEATNWIKEQHLERASGDKGRKELAERTILSAGEDYVDLFGSVYMGMEAIRIGRHAEVELYKMYEKFGSQEMKEKPEYKDMQDRLTIAGVGVHHFVGKNRPRVEEMKENYIYAKKTNEMDALILAASKLDYVSEARAAAVTRKTKVVELKR